jgi:hypothetical protein
MNDQHAAMVLELNRLWQEIVRHTEIQTACVHATDEASERRALKSQTVIRENWAKVEKLTGQLVGELEQSAFVMKGDDAIHYFTKQAE